MPPTGEKGRDIQGWTPLAGFVCKGELVEYSGRSTWGLGCDEGMAESPIEWGNPMWGL